MEVGGVDPVHAPGGLVDAAGPGVALGLARGVEVEPANPPPQNPRLWKGGLIPPSARERLARDS